MKMFLFQFSPYSIWFKGNGAGGKERGEKDGEGEWAVEGGSKHRIVFYPKFYPAQAQNNGVVTTLNLPTLTDYQDDKLKMNPWTCSSSKTKVEVIHKWLLKDVAHFQQ